MARPAAARGRLCAGAACPVIYALARPSCGLDADACPSPVPVAVKRSTLAWPIRRNVTARYLSP